MTLVVSGLGTVKGNPNGQCHFMNALASMQLRTEMDWNTMMDKIVELHPNIVENSIIILYTKELEDK